MEALDKSTRNEMVLENYLKEGFAVLKTNNAFENKLNKLRSEIYQVFNQVSLESCGREVKSDADIIDFFHQAQKAQFQAYKLIQGCPTLLSISGDSKIVEILQSMGLKTPIHELPPQIRCDMPVENQSIFLRHQDYVYNIGSSNSATIWIPLQDTPKEAGALLCVPGSHLGGIYPNKSGVILEQYKFDFRSCPVSFGELLIFHQKLVHQSGRNTSDRIRFSIQLRFTDVSDKEYAAAGFLLNHGVTTSKYLGEV